jgi:hypothetical protein
MSVGYDLKANFTTKPLYGKFNISNILFTLNLFNYCKHALFLHNACIFKVHNHLKIAGKQVCHQVLNEDIKYD